MKRLVREFDFEISFTTIEVINLTMADLLLSEAEKTFILHGVQIDVRNDGRSCRDYRPMELETEVVSNTSGSARIRLANTDVLVGIKAELEAPNPMHPDEGRIEFFTDCSANATPEFEGRGGEDLAQELSTTLKMAIVNSRCLDLKSLCVIPGQQCWVLYVDILVLECGGNLYDTASLTVKAALFNTKIPNVTVSNDESGHLELEVSDDPFDFKRIDVKSVPLLVTLTKIGIKLVVDPTLEEECCSLASIVLALHDMGNIVMSKKIGPGSFLPASVIEAFDVIELLIHSFSWHPQNILIDPPTTHLQFGSPIGAALNKNLIKQLEAEERLGKNRKRVGFL